MARVTGIPKYVGKIMMTSRQVQFAFLSSQKQEAPNISFFVCDFYAEIVENREIYTSDFIPIYIGPIFVVVVLPSAIPTLKCGRIGLAFYFIFFKQENI